MSPKRKKEREPQTPPVDPQVEKCIPLARSSGESIRSRLPQLTARQVVILQNAFRDGLGFVRTSGRKRDPTITAARKDQEAGLEGVALYRKHIPRYDRLSAYRREKAVHRFNDALQKRKKREKRGPSGAAVTP